MSSEQHAQHNSNMKMGNKSFEQFQYLRTTLTNQKCTHEGNNRRLTSGIACCHLVQNILSSSLLSENIKIKIFNTIILPIVFYGCETWSVTLREEHRLSGNTVLRKVFKPMREQVMGDWGKLHN
jgi:hypothetical protein